MKKLLVTISMLLALPPIQAQVYRNCTVLLNAVHRDSSVLSAQSSKAWLELDLLSNEVTLIVKLGTFESTDSIKHHDFDGPNEKFYFRGRFDGNAYSLLNEMVNDETQNLIGSVQLNGKEKRITAKYSIYKGSSITSENDRKLLFSLIIPIKLSDYQLGDELNELMDDLTIMLIRQPVNIVGAQEITH
jgi:hypothetical protein